MAPNPPNPPRDCSAESDVCRAVKSAGLVYASDSFPGYTRRASGKKFTFFDTKGNRITDPDIISRIHSIVIPPAWTDVWISPWQNAHLQATGRDQRGRKQYRYHQVWSKLRSETKYTKLIEFGEQLPELREKVDKDLQLGGMPRRKVLAAVVRLLELTHIRVGNEEYAQDNESYGLTTLRRQHVECNTNGCRFHFRGKSGREHEVQLQDRRLAKLIRKCHELPGQQLFHYMDKEANVQSIDSGDVNEYLRSISGDDFTAKNFRTWWGTVITAEALLGMEGSKSKTAIRNCIVSALKETAGKLGNRPATCRRYYVHPVVLDAFAQGTLCPALRKQLERARKSRPKHLEPIEAAVLQLLKCHTKT